jgi:hypothetical protein
VRAHALAGLGYRSVSRARIQVIAVLGLVRHASLPGQRAFGHVVGANLGTRNALLGSIAGATLVCARSVVCLGVADPTDTRTHARVVLRRLGEAHLALAPGTGTGGIQKDHKGTGCILLSRRIARSVIAVPSVRTVCCCGIGNHGRVAGEVFVSAACHRDEEKGKIQSVHRRISERE